MFKVIFVDGHGVGNLEAELNSAAEDGYQWVGMFQSTSRLVIIMEQRTSSGVPMSIAKRSHKKKPEVEESVLGA